MKTEYKYLHFVKVADKPKTSVWSCVNLHHNDTLGIIAWGVSWRQYVFTPTVHAVYSAGCLKDIACFIEALKSEV